MADSSRSKPVKGKRSGKGKGGNYPDKRPPEKEPGARKDQGNPIDLSKCEGIEFIEVDGSVLEGVSVRTYKIYVLKMADANIDTCIQTSSLICPTPAPPSILLCNHQVWSDTSPGRGQLHQTSQDCLPGHGWCHCGCTSVESTSFYYPIPLFPITRVCPHTIMQQQVHLYSNDIHREGRYCAMQSHTVVCCANPYTLSR